MNPMTPTRFTVIPEERFSELRTSIQSKVKTAASLACGEYFKSLLDSGILELLQCAFSSVGADEGTIWLLNDAKDALVPRYNSGERAREFVGKYRQPLTHGFVSIVFHTEQPLSENGVYRSARHDKTLDLKLGLHTCSMIAVPFVFCGELRGVISCVQVKPAAGDEPDPPGFTDEDLGRVQLIASAVGRLIDSKLLRLCLGIEEQS